MGNGKKAVAFAAALTAVTINPYTVKYVDTEAVANDARVKTLNVVASGTPFEQNIADVSSKFKVGMSNHEIQQSWKEWEQVSENEKVGDDNIEARSNGEVYVAVVNNQKAYPMDADWYESLVKGWQVNLEGQNTVASLTRDQIEEGAKSWER